MLAKSASQAKRPAKQGRARRKDFNQTALATVEKAIGDGPLKRRG